MRYIYKGGFLKHNHISGWLCIYSIDSIVSWSTPFRQILTSSRFWFIGSPIWWSMTHLLLLRIATTPLDIRLIRFNTAVPFCHLTVDPTSGTLKMYPLSHVWGVEWFAHNFCHFGIIGHLIVGEMEWCTLFSSCHRGVAAVLNVDGRSARRLGRARR